MAQQTLFQIPPLPYAYNALEPFIDEKTMMLHHNRHLKTYVDNLNQTLLDYPEYQSLSLTQLLCFTDQLPKDIQTSIKRNAGGVYNHIFFFLNMTPNAPSAPVGALKQLIDKSFSSFDNFKAQFTAAALSVFGSGYAWLVLAPDGRLKIMTTANQDTPVCFPLCPILNLDVWEHAYYLKHYNERKAYINDWFSVVNWEGANRNLSSCLLSQK